MQRFIIGLPSKKVELSTDINATNSEIKWTITASLKKLLKIQRNTMMFDSMMSGVLSNRLAKRYIKKHLSKDDQGTLKEMLTEQTSIEYERQTY